jgi:hypothetical protein
VIALANTRLLHFMTRAFFFFRLRHFVGEDGSVDSLGRPLGEQICPDHLRALTMRRTLLALWAVSYGCLAQAFRWPPQTSFLGENATAGEIDLEHRHLMLDCSPNLYTLEIHWGLL